MIDGATIDEALVIRFASGASFTGEQMVELHLHGGVAIVTRVLRELSSLSGFRPAEAGEFTRRALMSGSMDLAQVEGLADLIDAQTESQREQAVAVMGGALSEEVSRWRGKLIHALSLTEAAIDFADEEDAPVDVMAEVNELISDLRRDISVLIEGASFGIRLREGFVVALVGPPNVGKSSLINALANRDVAITSPIAGTTRDVIEVSCDFSGFPVTVLDTAGVRESCDEIESIGIERALKRAAEADIRVFMGSADEPREVIDGLWKPGDILLWNKADLAAGDGDIGVSAKTGENLASFIDLVVARLSDRSIGSGLIARERQASQLSMAHAELGMAIDSIDEFRSEHLKHAIYRLDEIVGAVDVEEVLGEIFSQFCIGK